MRQRKFIWLSPGEIRTRLPALVKTWKKNRSKCSFPAFVDDQLMQLNKLLRRKMESHMEIQVASLYNTISDLVNDPGKVDFERIMVLSNSGDTIRTFLKYNKGSSDRQYWEGLRSAYVQQSHVQLDHNLLRRLFSSEREGKQHLMTAREIATIKKMPSNALIYRGCALSEHNSGMYGISWSLSKSVAQDFATRLELKKVESIVAEKKIEKVDIVAYFSDRDEEEIIYIGPQAKNSKKGIA